MLPLCIQWSRVIIVSNYDIYMLIESFLTYVNYRSTYKDRGHILITRTSYRHIFDKCVHSRMEKGGYLLTTLTAFQIFLHQTITVILWLYHKQVATSLEAPNSLSPCLGYPFKILFSIFDLCEQR